MQKIGVREFTMLVIGAQEGLAQKISADQRAGFDASFADEFLERIFLFLIFEEKRKGEGRTFFCLQRDEMFGIAFADFDVMAEVPVADADKIVQPGELVEAKHCI